MRRAVRSAVLVAMAAFSVSAWAGQVRTIWYVDAGNTSGVEDGTTWATAFRSIQEGIQGASASGGSVWVAAGTYTAASSPVVTLVSHVDVYGGFAGTEGADAFDLRDPQANRTVIDGEGARRCVLGADHATLDGFVVYRGKPTATSTGGGLECRSVSPTVRNCDFVGNEAEYGAAVYWITGAIAIENCRFFRNLATQSAAAVLASNVAGSVNDCLFVGNVAYISGGALWATGPNTDLTVSRGRFATNRGWEEGGAVRVHNEAVVRIRECTFVGNFCSNGGALSNNWGGTWVTNSLFLGNSGVYGAGVYTWNDGSVNLINCTFRRNTAYQLGGSLYIGHNDLIMTNSILWDGAPDETHFTAGTQTVSYCNVKGGLAGTANLDADPRFRWAPSGGFEALIYDEETFQTTLIMDRASFTPGALAGMALLIPHPDPDDPPWGYLIADNMDDSITVWGDAGRGGTFEAPSTFEVLDWHLSAVSPCVDAGRDTGSPDFGDVATDIEGEARGFDGRGEGPTGPPEPGDGSDYDIGADENTGGIDPEAFHSCDINRDRKVDASDIQYAINAVLGIRIVPYDADVNGDSKTNSLDIQRVINVVLGLP